MRSLPAQANRYLWIRLFLPLLLPSLLQMANGQLLPWWFTPSTRPPTPYPTFRPIPVTSPPTRMPPRPPTLPTGGSYLNKIGNEPEWLLGKCEGDCDRDEDCQGSLVCFRVGKDFVWGCDGVVKKPDKHHYCMDLNDVMPTVSPTSSPTRNPTPRPTREPSRRPTPNPTPRPTEEPTKLPTVSPTLYPTEVPSRSPSVSPTVPQKLFVDMDPFDLTLYFSIPPEYVNFSDDDEETEDFVSKDGTDSYNGDNDASSAVPSISGKEYNSIATYLEEILSDYVDGSAAILNPFFWESYLNVTLIERLSANEDSGITERIQTRLLNENKGNIMSIKYQVAGQYSFVDTPDTALPAKEELLKVTANALDANALIRSFKRSDQPILNKIDSVGVKWTNEESSNASAGRTRMSKISIALLVITCVTILGTCFAIRHAVKEMKTPRSRSRLAHQDVVGQEAGDENGSHISSSWRSSNSSLLGHMPAWITRSQQRLEVGPRDSNSICSSDDHNIQERRTLKGKLYAVFQNRPRKHPNENNEEDIESTPAMIRSATLQSDMISNLGSVAEDDSSIDEMTMDLSYSKSIGKYYDKTTRRSNQTHMTPTKNITKAPSSVRPVSYSKTEDVQIQIPPDFDRVGESDLTYLEDDETTAKTSASTPDSKAGSCKHEDIKELTMQDDITFVSTLSFGGATTANE